MRLLKHFLLAIFSLFFLTSTTCESDYNDINVKNLNIPNLIEIEIHPVYNVNDILYINSSFSRYLPEAGYSTLLDIYKTTGSDRYGFSFNLEKKSAYNTWSNLDINSSLNIDKGEFQYGAICVLNNVTNQYEFRAGIPLLEAGQYRLSFQPYLNQYSYTNKLIVNINTTAADLDNEGFYNFTVN